MGRPIRVCVATSHIVIVPLLFNGRQHRTCWIECHLLYTAATDRHGGADLLSGAQVPQTEAAVGTAGGKHLSVRSERQPAASVRLIAARIYLRTGRAAGGDIP